MPFKILFYVVESKFSLKCGFPIYKVRIWQKAFLLCLLWTSGGRLAFLKSQKSITLYQQVALQPTGCPKKHGNSETNSISSLLWISVVIPNFKTHNIIMSARVYFMKRVKDCKDVSIMSLQDEQWRRTSLLCLYTVIFLFY